MSVQPATVKERIISFRSLASVHCPCGETKRARQSFCGRHWHALPGHLQTGLFRAEGYADVWLRALQELALPLPQLTGDPAASSPAPTKTTAQLDLL